MGRSSVRSMDGRGGMNVRSGVMEENPIPPHNLPTAGASSGIPWIEQSRGGLRSHDGARIRRSLHPGTNSSPNRQIFCLREGNRLPYICRLCKSIVSRKCKANLLTPRLASRKVEGVNREMATRMRPPVQRREVEKEDQDPSQERPPNRPMTVELAR